MVFLGGLLFFVHIQFLTKANILSSYTESEMENWPFMQEFSLDFRYINKAIIQVTVTLLP